MRKGIGIGLSLALLAGMFFFLSQEVEGAQVRELLQATAPWAVGAAVSALWLNFAISTERYRLILRSMPVGRPTFGALYRLTFFSLFVAHAVAVGPVADVVRVAYGRFRFDMPIIAAIESVLYDRVLALGGIAIVGLLLLPLQIAHGVPDWILVSQAILWLASLGGISIIIWGARSVLVQCIPFLARIASSVEGFLSAAGSGARILTLQIVLAIGYSVTYGLAIWILAQGMGLNLGVLDTLQFAPLILLAQSLPVFYVGWGIREAAVIGTLSSSGILAGDEALAVSVATGAVFFVASMPGAIVWLFLPKVASKTDAA